MTQSEDALCLSSRTLKFPAKERSTSGLPHRRVYHDPRHNIDRFPQILPQFCQISSLLRQLRFAFLTVPSFHSASASCVETLPALPRNLASCRGARSPGFAEIGSDRTRPGQITQGSVAIHLQRCTGHPVQLKSARSPPGARRGRKHVRTCPSEPARTCEWAASAS